MKSEIDHHHATYTMIQIMATIHDSYSGAEETSELMLAFADTQGGKADTPELAAAWSELAAACLEHTDDDGMLVHGSEHVITTAERAVVNAWEAAIDRTSYDANYAIPENRGPNTCFSLIARGTVEEIVIACVDHGVSATLYNANGSVGGYVKADGTWSLQ